MELQTDLDTLLNFVTTEKTTHVCQVPEATEQYRLSTISLMYDFYLPPDLRQCEGHTTRQIASDDNRESSNFRLI
jgi:hypothetical protein